MGVVPHVVFELIWIDFGSRPRAIAQYSRRCLLPFRADALTVGVSTPTRIGIPGGQSSLWVGQGWRNQTLISQILPHMPVQWMLNDKI